MKILNRFTSSILYEDKKRSIKATLTAAVGTGANLRGANLGDANLGGAKNIIACWVPPPCGYFWAAVWRENTIWISAGCRWQTIADRERQVRDEQSDINLEVRLNTITYIKSQAEALEWSAEPQEVP